MITPSFSCSQSDTSVTVSVYCPSIRAADVEIRVLDSIVTIHIHPYFLRLHFSANLLDSDDNSDASYNPTSGYLTVTLIKATPGQEFKDLDLLAKLLAPLPSVVGSTSNLEEDNVELEDELVNKTANMSLQEEHEEFLKGLLLSRLRNEKPYGFLDKYSGYFEHVGHSENEVNDLGTDAEMLRKKDRHKRRRIREDKKWDEEHYMADYVDDDMIECIIEWTHPLSLENESMEFTEAEKHIFSTSQESGLYLTLVQVLFAYAYETRTTELDPSPESPWTLCILVPSFSSLHAPEPTGENWTAEDLTLALVASYRRALAFPLYRSWALCERCRQDIAHFIGTGKRAVTRALLWVKDLLDHHEVYYVYSKIWIGRLVCLANVHIIFIYSDEQLKKLSNSLETLHVAKSSIGWDLEELEAASLQPTSNPELDSDDE
ncbi:SHQ1 protein-domain-containing protein [Flagelloscypha sp. PMI_526]|nr:SHQ1 protein-domain-containing protein [Flagelloscypha sp. PMI_526]